MSSGTMLAKADDVQVLIFTERSRWHDAVIEHEIWLNGPDDRMRWPIEPGQGPASVFSAEWFDRIMRDLGVTFTDPKDQESHRSQLIHVVKQLNASGTMPPTLNTPMKITYSTQLTFSPGSIQVILIALSGIVVLAYITRWAVRYSETRHRVYHEKRMAVAERYRRQVERTATKTTG